MIDLLNFSTLFLNYVRQLFSGDAPWWVYALIALIPICIVVTVREVFCWFIKVNTFVRKLEKIDKRLAVLTSSFEELARVLKSNAQISKIRPDEIKRNYTGEYNAEEYKAERRPDILPDMAIKNSAGYKPSLDYDTNDSNVISNKAVHCSIIESQANQEKARLNKEPLNIEAVNIETGEEPDSERFTLGLGGKNWK